MECLADARLQTSMSAFEVLTPPNPDYRELIQSMHAPILLVIGDKAGVSLDTARELRELNPLLRYELIPDAGHGVPYDQPERLGAAMLSFLRPISAVRTGAAFVD
ncbi:pimeloyl-ACP methyl ester carboxylesterase [Rhizobium sp. SG570]|nr:pimeloyl-ACP methyl ester carboxylesterase [Rhizobium sp. SG570]